MRNSSFYLIKYWINRLRNINSCIYKVKLLNQLKQVMQLPINNNQAKLKGMLAYGK